MKLEKPKDDIAVRREAISELFNPPPRKTAFHDMVNKGKIAMAGDLRGYYLLNATRLRNGFPEVDIKTYRAEAREQSHEYRTRLLKNVAVICVDPDLSTLIPNLKLPEALESDEIEQVRSYVKHFQPDYEKLEDDRSRLAMIKGWVDAS